MKIPLIVYGENPQFEYGGPVEARKPKPMNRRWRQEFGGLRGLREEDLVDAQISMRDLEVLRFLTMKKWKAFKVYFMEITIVGTQLSTQNLSKDWLETASRTSDGVQLS